MTGRQIVPMRAVLAFDREISVQDGYGGEVNEWSQQFESRGDIMYLRGGETVQSGRLQGRQAVVVTVFRNPDTQSVTPEWRVRDLVQGVTYNIRTKVPSDDGIYFELTCESGVAV